MVKDCKPCQGRGFQSEGAEKWDCEECDGTGRIPVCDCCEKDLRDSNEAVRSRQLEIGICDECENE